RQGGRHEHGVMGQSLDDQIANLDAEPVVLGQLGILLYLGRLVACSDLAVHPGRMRKRLPYFGRFVRREDCGYFQQHCVLPQGFPDPVTARPNRSDTAAQPASCGGVWTKIWASPAESNSRRVA